MKSPAMTATAWWASISQVTSLLRAEPGRLGDWVQRWQTERVLVCVGIIVLGAGLYGAAMGCWRSALQAVFTGIKLPLVILLTTLGNGLLNGMVAPLLGLNVSFRQSLQAVLLTFTLAALMLGAFAPLAAFVAWNTPPLTGATQLSSPEYGFLQLVLVVFIAGAGVTGNLCVLPLLKEWAGSAVVAWRVLLAWLAANLLLGSQISWLLRPFIWDPAGAERFIGQEYLRGSFFETVFEALRRLAFS
jgi:hypothetical protein